MQALPGQKEGAGVLVAYGGNADNQKGVDPASSCITERCRPVALMGESGWATVMVAFSVPDVQSMISLQDALTMIM